jgi:hypothetical protein
VTRSQETCAYTKEDAAIFARQSVVLGASQLRGDRNDAEMMATREREKFTSIFSWEAWETHRREWFPSGWGQP